MKKLGLATIALASLVGLAACNNTAPAKKTPAGESLMLEILALMNPRQKEFVKGEIDAQGNLVKRGDYYEFDDDMMDTGNPMYYAGGYYNNELSGDDEADCIELVEWHAGYFLPDSVKDYPLFDEIQTAQMSDGSWCGYQYWTNEKESAMMRFFCYMELYDMDGDGTPEKNCFTEIETWTLPKGYFEA